MARPFIWTPAKEAALRWRCEGRLTQAEQAALLGVTRRTLEGWIRRDAFREHYAAYAAERHAACEAQWQSDRRTEVARRCAEAEAEAEADLAAIRAKYRRKYGGRWMA